MMHKPFQVPVSPRNSQHPPINNMPKTIPNRIVFAGPSPSKIVTQPHRIHNSPSQQYMMHLVPQQPPLQNTQPHINRSSNIFRLQSSSIINKFGDKKSQLFTQSILSVERPQTIINVPNLGSTSFRSRVTSQLSNKQSKLTTQRNQYLMPQSPTNLRRMEPVRRLSHHRLKISSADKQGREQSIKIVIETNSANNQIDTPSRITISHSQGATNNQMQANNGSLILCTQPQIIQSMPIKMIGNPQVTNIAQNSLQRTTNTTKNCGMNQQSYFKPSPDKTEKNVEHRAYSYSMGSKYISLQNKQENLMKSNFKFKQQRQPEIMVLDDPSDLFLDKKPISFSLQQNEQLMQSKSVKQPQRKKGEIQSQKKTKNQKRELSIQSGKVYKQDRKKTKKQVYNQYYDQAGLQSYNSSKGTHQRRNYLMYQHQQTLFASALLLNQIYENQVNKALLKMNVVQNKSREKSMKRRDF